MFIYDAMLKKSIKRKEIIREQIAPVLAKFKKLRKTVLYGFPSDTENAYAEDFVTGEFWEDIDSIRNKNLA